MIQKLAALLALAGVIVAILLWPRPREVGSVPAAPAATSESPSPGSDERQRVVASSPLGSPTLPVADPSAYADLHSAHTSAQQDVRILDAIVQNFQLSLKTSSAVPPLGFNDEITRALTGGNPLELAFIPSTHAAINARGELCDRWGTPYSFHPVAADRIDVRSAGPDRRLFTADDVLSQPAAVVTVE